MLKNTVGKWIVFAFDRTTGNPKTGDGANITANLRFDGGTANAVDDTNPTELEDGFYIFDITAAESNGDLIVICPASSTSNIQVIGVPATERTTTLTSTRIGNLDELAAANLPTDVAKLLQVLTGKWEITNNQLIMYDSDGTTALYTFNLTRDGIATEFNPSKRAIA